MHPHLQTLDSRLTGCYHLVMSGLADEIPWEQLMPKVLTFPWTIYKQRYNYNRLQAWLRAALRIGATDILVTGRSGAGKSVLVENLVGATGSVDWRPPKKSKRVEHHVLRLGEWYRVIRVVPGQFSKERAEELGRALEKRPCSGVIHISDWGYNLPRDPAAKANLKAHLEEKYGSASLESLRRHNLEEELRDFEMMAERISNAVLRAQRPKWLAIVCTKADLYFTRLNEANDYYHPLAGGSFARVVQRLQKRLGEVFTVVALPAAPHPEVFSWNSESVNPQVPEEGVRRGLLLNLRDKLAECYS